MNKVIILGAKGRFGRAAVTAFVKAGWDVTAFGRDMDPSQFPKARCVQGDVQNADQLTQACAGMDVIIHAIHPPYVDWAKAMPQQSANIIAATRAADATVIIPGNIYNYGANMPPVLTEETPWRPTTRKGQLRVVMENTFKDANVRTIVLRAGDYFEAAKTGNWFDSYMTTASRQGKTLYPGPMDVMHAWAYLPDMARAAVGLAERRADFGRFEAFGFAGHSVTGQQMVDQIGVALGVPQKRKKMPWGIVRLMGLVSPFMREVAEMRYLWQLPHRVDGTKLATALPDFEPTPFAQAVGQALGEQAV